jgi:transposase-like protein
MKHGKYSKIRLEGATRTGKKVSHSLEYRAVSCKMYMCAQHQLIQLNNKQRCFLDYLCEKMDEDNTVYIDREFKNKFIEITQDFGNKKYSFTIGIIDKAIAQLVKLNLILLKQQGYYIVNPRYFFKGSETNRLELLKKEVAYRFNNNLPLNGLLPIPEEKIRNAESIIHCLN